MANFEKETKISGALGKFYEYLPVTWIKILAIECSQFVDSPSFSAKERRERGCKRKASEKVKKKGSGPLDGIPGISIIGVVPVGKAEDAPDKPPGGLIEGFGDVLE